MPPTNSPEEKPVSPQELPKSPESIEEVVGNIEATVDQETKDAVEQMTMVNQETAGEAESVMPGSGPRIEKVGQPFVIAAGSKKLELRDELKRLGREMDQLDEADKPAFLEKHKDVIEKYDATPLKEAPGGIPVVGFKNYTPDVDAMKPAEVKLEQKSEPAPLTGALAWAKGGMEYLNEQMKESADIGDVVHYQDEIEKLNRQKVNWQMQKPVFESSAGRGIAKNETGATGIPAEVARENDSATTVEAPLNKDAGERPVLNPVQEVAHIHEMREQIMVLGNANGEGNEKVLEGLEDELKKSEAALGAQIMEQGTDVTRGLSSFDAKEALGAYSNLVAKEGIEAIKNAPESEKKRIQAEYWDRIKAINQARYDYPDDAKEPLGTTAAEAQQAPTESSAERESVDTFQGVTLENIGDKLNELQDKAFSERDPVKKQELMDDLRALEKHEGELKQLAERNVTFDDKPVEQEAVFTPDPNIPRREIHIPEHIKEMIKNRGSEPVQTPPTPLDVNGGNALEKAPEEGRDKAAEVAKIDERLAEINEVLPGMDLSSPEYAPLASELTDLEKEKMDLQKEMEQDRYDALMSEPAAELTGIDAMRAERRENVMGESRKEFVDAMDNLRDWFTGKTKESPYNTMMGAVGRKLNALVNRTTRAEWDRKPHTQAVKLVEVVTRNMMADPSKTVEEQLAHALTFKKGGFPEFASGSDAEARIIEAIKAKHAYESRRQGMVKERVSAAELAGNTPEILASYNAEIFKDFVLDEYEKQNLYRVQKELEAHPPSKMRKIMQAVGATMKKGFSGYAKLPLAMRLTIGVAIGSAVAIGLTGPTAGVAGAIIVGRAGRGVASYFGGKLSARAYEKMKGRKLMTDEQIKASMADGLGLEDDDEEVLQNENETIGEANYREFIAIEQAMKQLVESKALEAKIARRKNIAAVLGGGLIALNSAVVQGVVTDAVNNMPGSTSTGAPLETGTVKPVPVPGGTPTPPGTGSAIEQPGSGVSVDQKPGVAAPEQQKFATNTERMAAGKGFEVGKGGSIWQGVKEQVKHYVTTPDATPEQLGVKMTPEQFQAFKADIADGGSMSPENARFLDRIVATSINKNNMMSFGIRNPGEVVMWKPGADGGKIEFGSGNKALYDMNTNRPVALDNLPQQPSTGASSAMPNSVEQPTTTGGGAGVTSDVVNTSESATTTNEVGVVPEVAKTADWTQGLTAEEIRRAQPLFEEFKRQTGIDLMTPEGAVSVGDMNTKFFFQQIPAELPGPARVTIQMPDGTTKAVMVTPEMARLRSVINPSSTEMQGTLKEVLKNRIAAKGSPTLIEPLPKPSENVVNLKQPGAQTAAPVAQQGQPPVESVQPVRKFTPSPQLYANPYLNRPQVVFDPKAAAAAARGADVVNAPNTPPGIPKPPINQ